MLESLNFIIGNKYYKWFPWREGFTPFIIMKILPNPQVYIIIVFLSIVLSSKNDDPCKNVPSSAHFSNNHISAFAQDSYCVSVCSKSTLCMLPIWSHNIKETFIQGSRFNTVMYYFFIKNIRCEIGFFKKLWVWFGATAWVHAQQPHSFTHHFCFSTIHANASTMKQAKRCLGAIMKYFYLTNHLTRSCGTPAVHRSYFDEILKWLKPTPAQSKICI